MLYPADTETPAPRARASPKCRHGDRPELGVSLNACRLNFLARVSLTYPYLQFAGGRAVVAEYEGSWERIRPHLDHRMHR